MPINFNKVAGCERGNPKKWSAQSFALGRNMYVTVLYTIASPNENTHSPNSIN
jgi:hypothetical protein